MQLLHITFLMNRNRMLPDSHTCIMLLWGFLLGCMHCNGIDYRGTIMKTESGILCQQWDSQTHHKHNYTPDK